MSLTVGARLHAQNSPCQVIVVKAPADDGRVVLCGGVEMLSTAGDDGAPIVEGPSVQLGKRYSDDGNVIELLCTKAGVGPLVYGEEELSLKGAKPLPASD